MSVRIRGLLLGLCAAAVLAAGQGLASRVVARGDERSITIYNIHTKETVTAVFKRDGKFDAAGLKKINHIMRDYRRNEETQMDPNLVDLIWQIHRDLGSSEPVHLISGYRSRSTNDMLRRTVGGQASQSRHILGKAADVHFPDVPIKKLRYAALIRERGGVGYYPTSAIPFVHVDTDRVRSWPRVPRQELALLFPAGSTRHLPATGGPITPDDVRIARTRNPVLTQQIVAFFNERGRDGAVAMAEARPSQMRRPEPIRVALSPRTIEPAAPTLAEMSRTSLLPPRLAAPMAPSARDRAKLAELALFASTMPRLVSGPVLARRPARTALPSLGHTGLPAPPDTAIPGHNLPTQPERQVAAIDANALAEGTIADIGRFGWGAWIPAPAFDEEHPEELSYRPFPIAPYLTDTASQALMSELVAHDVAHTVDMLDQLDNAPALHFRPSTATASLLWAQQFTGSAVGIEKLRQAAHASEATPSGNWLKSRPVRTSQR